MRQAAASWPISSRVWRALKLRNRPDPAGPAHELALTHTLKLAIVGQKMQQRLHGVGGEQAANRLVQMQLAARHRSVRKKRRMKMPLRASPRGKTPHEGRDLRQRLARRDTHDESEIPFVGPFGGERKPVAHTRKRQR